VPWHFHPSHLAVKPVRPKHGEPPLAITPLAGVFVFV